MKDKLIGQRYRTEALIGEGGMASVYSALDEKLGRKVAIKILHPHLGRNPDVRERFLLEAKTVSTLDHPNIIKVYDFSGLDSDSEQLWMVTEILYGQDLADYVKAFPKHRLHFVVATLVTREICRALHEAHKLNIVHRDIKPENIMMLANGQVKLMDFGIAKVHRANATQTGIFMGSPSYMSPEQIRGSDVDIRADIYSLSVLFYEIVTGTLPYIGQTTADVINRIMVGRYTQPNRLVTELPKALNDIIVTGMQGQKEQRFKDILQMSNAMDLFLQTSGLRESRTELEEFSLNRARFEERLGSLAFPIDGQQGPSAQVDSKGQAYRPNITRYHASHEAGERGAQDTLQINPQAEAKKGPPIPTIAPSVTVSLEGVADLQPSPGSRVNAPGKIELDLKSKLPPPTPSAKADEAAVKARGPASQKTPRNKITQSPPTGKSEGSSRSHRTTGSGQNSPFRGTQPPNSNPKSTRSGSKKAVYMEVSEFERHPKKSSLSTVIIFALIAAIALVVVFGKDRTVKGKRDRNTESISKVDRKDAAEHSEPTPAPAVPPPAHTPAPAPAPHATETAKLPPKMDGATTTVIEPQITTIEKKPKTLPEKVPPLPPKQAAVVKPAQEKPKAKVEAPKEEPVKTARPEPISPVSSSPVEKAPEDKIPERPFEKFEPKGPGTLKIVAQPAARVFVDGKAYGTTNSADISERGIRLDPGSYALKIFRPGYKAEEQTVQIKAGEARTLNFALVKSAEQQFELTVRTNRSPVTVLVEGPAYKKEIPLNKSSLQLKLKPGSYKVDVRYQAEAITRTVELSEDNKSITFNAEFK